MTTNYALDTNQKVIMMQLDLGKKHMAILIGHRSDAYSMSFGPSTPWVIFQLGQNATSLAMHSMSFERCMPRVIFLLGQNAKSCVRLKSRVTQIIFLVRSMWQGCPLSPLLFVIILYVIVSCNMYCGFAYSF